MTNSAPTSAAAAPLGDLLHLERRAFGAATPEALGFTIVNESSVLAPYRQAALFTVGATGGLSLSHASGLVTVSADTPYAVWLTQLANAITQQPAVQLLEIDKAPPHLTDGWQEWLPAHLL